VRVCVSAFGCVVICVCSVCVYIYVYIYIHIYICVCVCVTGMYVVELRVGSFFSSSSSSKRFKGLVDYT